MKYYKRIYNETDTFFKWGQIYPESDISHIGFVPDRWQEVTEKDYLLQEAKNSQGEEIEQTHKDLLISIYSLDVPFNVKHELANKTVDALVKTSDHYMTKMIKP